MPKIDADYVKQRAVEVHSEESFARTFFDHILRAAEESLSASGPLEEVVVNDISATVSQHKSSKGTVCVEISVQTPFGSVRRYVP